MSIPTKANELPLLDEVGYFIGGRADGRYGRVPYMEVPGVARAEEAAVEAVEAAEAAVSAAASINLPAISGPDARKTLRVKPDGSGYYLTSRPMVAILAYSQSNFARTQPLTSWDGPIPDNLFVWNGGVGGTVGTQFNPVAAAFTNQMRVPVAYAARLAAESPDTDFYLVICASGGVGVRSVVGMRYNWATSLAGDPGTGKIGLNHASPGSATQVRYSATDAEGWVRFVGGSSLGVSAVTPCRIEVAGNPAAYVEIRPGAVTDQGAYRTQPVTVSASASWPPADGTPVNVYQATDWLREIIRANSEAALTWLGLTGDARKFDRMVLWPTESDVAYADSYVQRDFPALLDYLGAWADSATKYLHTLPWPHATASAAGVRRWWVLLEDALSKRTWRSTLVDLSASPLSAWEPGVNDYVHVNTGDDMQMFGRLIHESEKTGGLTLPRYASGFWSPTVTPVENVDAAFLINQGIYQRVGRVINFSVRLTVDPTTNAAQTRVKLTLPVAADLKNPTDAIGLCGSSVRAWIGNVAADPADETLVITFTAESTTAHAVWVQGQYIIP